MARSIYNPAEILENDRVLIEDVIGGFFLRLVLRKRSIEPVADPERRSSWLSVVYGFIGTDFMLTEQENAKKEYDRFKNHLLSLDL